MKVYVAAVQPALWLRELTSYDQAVEALSDRDDTVRSRRQRSRQSVTSWLRSYLLGIAQQASQHFFASAILFSGCRSQSYSFPVPSNALCLACPQACEQVVDAQNRQRRHIEFQKTSAAQSQHFDDGTAIRAKDRFGRHCPCRTAEALHLTVIGVEAKPSTETLAQESVRPEADFGEKLFGQALGISSKAKP